MPECSRQRNYFHSLPLLCAARCRYPKLQTGYDTSQVGRLRLGRLGDKTEGTTLRSIPPSGPCNVHSANTPVFANVTRNALFTTPGGKTVVGPRFCARGEKELLRLPESSLRLLRFWFRDTSAVRRDRLPASIALRVNIGPNPTSARIFPFEAALFGVT